MTYTALATLAILGDDYSRVDRKGIAAALRAHQLPDGSFTSAVEGGESDMRFMYCACTIAYLLNDWSGIDIEKAVSHIKSSFAPGGGFGQRPHLEAHGGSTFCATASLWLLVGGAQICVLTVTCFGGLTSVIVYLARGVSSLL